MTLQVFWHPDVLCHDTGAGVFEGPPSPLLDVPEAHPEGVARVRNMRAILQRGPLAGAIEWREGRHASVAELALVHDVDYVRDVQARIAAGGGRLTSTTLLAADSWPGLTAAAGTALTAAEAVLDGTTRTAYALLRPPGHHAQPAQADGYCFFNHAALAAELARSRGVSRVAIVDWDVHHGNGTQACFWERSDVLTVSLHMDHGAWGPSHPQTGRSDEVGAGEGAGCNLNVALPLGTGDAGYERAMAEVVEPVLDAFAPQLVIGAIGQDAAQFDPNGRQAVTMAGFRALGRRLAGVAERHADGRLLLVQEGGYAPSYAAFCLHATLEGVLGRHAEIADPIAYLPDDPSLGIAAIAAARDAISPWWDLEVA